MLRVLQKPPFRLPCFIKFLIFGNILSHKQELLSRMCHHIGIGKPQIGKFIFFISRHLTNHGRFTMHHFIMGKYTHKILAVLIHHAESQFIMMMGTEIWIIADIGKIIIHESHIPFHGKSKSIFLYLTGHLRPCCRFLCNQIHVRIFLFHNRIQML